MNCRIPHATAARHKPLMQLNEDIERRVEQIKHIIYGEPDEKDEKGVVHGPDPTVIEAVARAFMAEEIMPLALAHLKSVGFEIRKSFVTLFVFLLRHDCAGFATTYMPSHTNLLYQLVDGYVA